jgi:type IV secretory pathway VirD2 relaxase
VERDEIDIPGALRPRNRRATGTDVHRIPRFRSSLLSRVNRGPSADREIGFGETAARGTGRSLATFSGERRCVVKARYVRMNAAGSKAAQLHLKYLERDGVEVDGSPGRLYGVDASFDAVAFAEPQAGEPHQFRVIVSPEDAGELDLKEFARGLMRQVEADLGRSLVWAAVNHFNTDRPHVHLVIRGIDGDGTPLRIPPRYISHGMRESAEQLLTRQLGLRSEMDVARQRSQEVGAERFTSLDHQLGTFVGEDGTFAARVIAQAARTERSLLSARLATLSRLGLAERRGLSWVFDEGWERSLRALGMRGDIIKRLAASVTGDLGPHRVLDAAPARPFDGIVRGKGLHDELAGTFFLAVGSVGGETFYVPVPGALAETLEVGDIVRVGGESDGWVKPNDRVVAKFAELHGGIYDPVAHERNLAELGRRAGTGSLPPGVLIAANVRRLERLAKFGLAERLPGGRWEVPADLVRQLEQRELGARPQRLRVSRLGPGLDIQVTHEGPTWLDRVSDDGDGTAGHGFGAELARARRARAAFLEKLGIDLARSDAATVREELDILALARRLRDTSQTDYVRATAGFRGEVVERHALPSGTTYLRVAESSGRRFTLVRVGNAGPGVGTRVELRAEPAGGREVRRIDERSPERSG